MNDAGIKSLVCDNCWQSFFTFNAFQTAWTAEESRSKGFSYTTTWEAIRTSAARGCNWCKLVAAPAKKSTGECTIRVAFSTETQGYTPSGVKKFELQYNGENGSFGSQGYRLYANSGNNASEIIRPKDRILQVGTPTSYKLALDCLDRCIRTHDKCPKPLTLTLPTRVLDCSNLERPKLVITNNDSGIYAILSYVWGKNQTLLTTSENIDSFVKDGINMQLLPKTVQDALTATHNLGIPYLWIDALCILQDSDVDKGREIGQMNKIYTNSYLTIIAACANDVAEGFLHDRPARIPSAHIPFICPDGKVGEVYLASTEMIGYDVTQMYHDEMEPVNYRGWCLQERVLSQRSFVFASDTLKYVCQTETVNIGDAFCEPSTGPRLPRAFTPNQLSLSPKELVRARQSWLYMIWEYSRRSLSRPDEDKLNAMSGIAEHYHKIWRTKYYAGLWEHTFLEDLLWYIEGSRSESQKPNAYRAPSWSWASVDIHTTAPNFESKLKPGAYDIGRATLVHCHVS